MIIRTLLMSALIIGTGAAGAAAQEPEEEAEEVESLEAEAGAENEFTEPPNPESTFTLNTGGEVELTFPPDGATRSLSAYLEAEHDGLYGGILGKVTSEADADKIQLSFGYRAETERGFSYDLSYTRFFFPNEGGDCCGELALAVGQSLNDRIAVTGEITFDPEASLGSVTLGTEFLLSDAVALSANFGLFEEEGSGIEQEWDAGVIWSFSEEAALDVRYFDGSSQEGYLGLLLTFDTTIFGG
jgi:hypothetical protein